MTNINRNIKLNIGIILAFIFLFTFITNDANAEAGWQAEPCTYGERNELCKLQRKDEEVALINSTLANANLTRKECHAFSEKLANELTKNVTGGRTYIETYYVVRRNCMEALFNPNN